MEYLNMDSNQYIVTCGTTIFQVPKKWELFCLMRFGVLRWRTVRMITRPGATATSDPYKWSVTKFCWGLGGGRRRKARTWSPRTAAAQRRVQSADGSLDDSILAHRLLPPASSSLCRCFNLSTVSCISRPGPVSALAHDIEAGKAPTGLFHTAKRTEWAEEQKPNHQLQRLLF